MLRVFVHRVFIREPHMWNGGEGAGLAMVKNQFAITDYKSVAQTSRGIWNT